MQIQVTCDGAYYVAVIEHHMVEVVGPVAVRIDVDLPAAIAPGEVGDLGQRRRAAHALQAGHELAQRFLGRIAADDEVHERVADQLLVVVGGREAAEDDGRVGMVAFDHLGNGQRAVGMGQPVQIDAERDRIERGDQRFGIEFLVVEHADGEIENADAELMPLQILGHRREADGVHLEDRRGRHQVADGSIEDGVSTEIIHAGCV